MIKYYIKKGKNMITDIVFGVCFVAFLLFLLGVIYIGVRYDSGSKYYECNRDPFYWASTITFPREDKK